MGYGLDLAERREPAEGLDLDLADALAREAEAAADLLERLRLVVGEAVAEDEHLALAVGEGAQRRGERLAAERELDLLLGERPLAGDEVAQDRVLLVSDRLVEAGRGPGGGARVDVARRAGRRG